MERKLASVQRIAALDPIPGADRIERASILGWKVVVKKGEFKVGDLCVFFEIDSILPFNPWNAFLQKDNRPIRLRTVKMKKQLSQGLALPCGLVLPMGMNPAEGMDVTNTLGVTKYEPPIPMNLDALGPRPHWVHKTDEMRVQSMPSLFEEIRGKDCYVTQKLDGSSMSLSNTAGGLHICSRNQSLKLDSNNNFTRVGLPLLEKLPLGYVIQGELVGPGIQSNRMGLAEHKFAVFNVWQGERLLSHEEALIFCLNHGFEHVKVLYVGLFKWTLIDELIELAVGSYDNGYPQEGIVVRPTTPVKHEELSFLSFKVINNEFLLKED